MKKPYIIKKKTTYILSEFNYDIPEKAKTWRQ